MSWGQVLWSLETGWMGDCAGEGGAGMTPRPPAVRRTQKEEAMEDGAGISSGGGCPSPHPYPPPSVPWPPAGL